MASYELIASPPGTGKTHFCVELFRQEILKAEGGLDSQSYFILPSREHADRIQNLILKKDIPGLFNAHIVTINDLMSRLLGFSPGLYPTDALRLRLLKQILAEERDWSYFGEVKTFGGFLELLLDTIKEFRSTLLSVSDFERACQPLLKEANFRFKFKDFSILMKRYENALKKLNLREPEEDLELLHKEKDKIPAISLLIFDGFYHLTPAQLCLIELLKPKTNHMVVTLTSGDSANRPHVFNYTLETCKHFLRMGFKEPKSGFTHNHRALAKDLEHLERNLFLVKPQKTKEATAIQILEAPNLKTELQMIARQIRRTYREKEVHFSDICVILRVLSGKESLIESIFKQYEIPFFLHERKKMIEHGVIQLLYRFIRLLHEDFRREDVLFILKSPVFGAQKKRSAIHELEILSWAKNCSRGKANWAELMASEECADEQKEIIGKIFKIAESLNSVESARELEKKILGFYDDFLKLEFEKPHMEKVDIKVRQTLKDILQNTFYFSEEKQSNFDLASTFEDLLKTIEKSLYSYKPPTKNRVQIYDAVLAMPKEYKVVFVADLTEKSFPQTVLEDPLFKDAERQIMNQKAPILEERLLRRTGERYFFYMAVTRARSSLYLSYSLYDKEGKPLLPSFFLREVEKCFSLVPVQRKSLQDALPSPDEWEREEEVLAGLGYAVFNLSDEKPPIQTIYKAWEKKTEFQDVLNAGRSTEKAIITDPRILEIFKKQNNRFSATKLETFATCAFKYHSDRILNLQVPFEDTKYLDMGKILHAVLQKFYESQKVFLEEKSFWSDLPALQEMLLKYLDEEFKKSEYFSHEPFYRKRIYFNRMKKILVLFAEDEKNILEARDFYPKYFEKSFEGFTLEDATYPILLDGFIDRLDVSRDGKRALVIDYKLSRRAQSIDKKLEKGLEIQLPLYGLFVQTKLGLKLAGLELRLLQDRKAEGLYVDEERDSLGLGPRKAVYTQDEMESILELTEKRIREYVNRVRNADIAIQSKNCDFCDYRSVCRFEKWKLVYES